MARRYSPFASPHYAAFSAHVRRTFPQWVISPTAVTNDDLRPTHFPYAIHRQRACKTQHISCGSHHIARDFLTVGVALTHCLLYFLWNLKIILLQKNSGQSGTRPYDYLVRTEIAVLLIKTRCIRGALGFQKHRENGLRNHTCSTREKKHNQAQGGKNSQPELCHNFGVAHKDSMQNLLCPVAEAFRELFSFGAFFTLFYFFSGPISAELSTASAADSEITGASNRRLTFLCWSAEQPQMVHFTPLSNASGARSLWKKSPQAAVQVGLLYFQTVPRLCREFEVESKCIIFCWYQDVIANMNNHFVMTFVSRWCVF
ncbi:hypothetical protein B0H14DRAFT_2640757 [Mycena olivaceomarginata]|nr:hypothetical protein B0H14DRAFT_2640757 [Mycena olivaceomarginata]